MNIKSFCQVVALYTKLLDWYVDFGPELPNGAPDRAYDLLVDSYAEFEEVQRRWKEVKGSELLETCFSK